MKNSKPAPKLRLTVKTCAALAHLRHFDCQQEGLTDFDGVFARLAKKGLVRLTSGNICGERFWMLTPAGENAAYAAAHRY